MCAGYLSVGLDLIVTFWRAYFGSRWARTFGFLFLLTNWKVYLADVRSKFKHSTSYNHEKMKLVESIIISGWQIDTFMRTAKTNVKVKYHDISSGHCCVVFIGWENWLWNSCWMASAKTTRALNWTKLCCVACVWPQATSQAVILQMGLFTK